MRLESRAGLKQQLLKEVVEPFVVMASRLRGRGKSDGASITKAGGLAGGPIAFGVSARPSTRCPKIPRCSIALGVGAAEGANTSSCRPRSTSQPCPKARCQCATSPVEAQGRGRRCCRRPHRQAGKRAARGCQLAYWRRALLVIPWYQRNKQTTGNRGVRGTRRCDREATGVRQTRWRQPIRPAVEQPCPRERGSGTRAGSQPRGSADVALAAGDPSRCCVARR